MIPRPASKSKAHGAPGKDSLIAKASVSELSTIGSVLSRIMEIIREPDSSISDLKTLIDVDPPLSAKVLRRANSAYYGLRREVLSIQEAIVFLGFRTLREIAFTLKAVKIFESGLETGSYSRKELWKHSLAIALCAKNIYRKEFRQHGDDIYSTALLHDIGIMVIEQFAPDIFTTVIKTVEEEQISIEEAEKKLLGYNHAEIGMELAIRWNLPAEIVKAIGYHHSPLRAPEEYAKATMIIFVSDYICKTIGIGFRDSTASKEELYLKCLEHLDLVPENIEIIADEVMEDLKAMEESGELYS